MMLRHVLLLSVLVLTAVLPTQAAPVYEGGDSSPTTTAQPPVQRATIRRRGTVYSYPTADAPALGRVNVGDAVVVHERIGDWYRIAVERRTGIYQPTPIPDGWVDGDLLDGALDGVPPATRPTTMPTPTPTPVPNPDAPAQEVIGTAVPDLPVSEVPRSAGAGAGASVQMGSQQPTLIARPVIVQQCADANGNQACDVTEGIAGVTAYVLDARTGQVLGQSISDKQGIAQVFVIATSDVPLVINVPYLGQHQAFRMTQADVKPILVADEAAIPGLVP